MADDKYLHIYLNDHLAGATAGVELARRAASNNEGTEFGGFLETIATEIDEDRVSLEEIMDAVGGTKDHIKQGAAWFAEKLGRLKLNGQLLGYSELSRLIEIEGLSAGVEAKLCLWNSLQQLAAEDDRLDGALLENLIRRGRSQRKRLEEKRLEAADIALNG
jgi:hypothetical protein